MAKTQIDLSDIVMSQEFLQTFTIIRSSDGVWIKGRFVQNTQQFEMSGVVTAINEKDITMIPEGDRNSEKKTFHTIEPLYVTRNDNSTKGISDIILYEGYRYKIVTVVDASDYGYYRATGVKITADD